LAGSVLLLVGVIGDRILKVAVTRQGAELTLNERMERLEPVIEEAEANAPVVPLTSLGLGQGAASIVGSYWSQPAVDTLKTAYGSNTRIDFDHAVDRLQDQAAAGTAVVKIEPAATDK
jgi:hypothetical protein